MGYKKVIHIDDETDKILDMCIQEFLSFHPEMRKIRISRNKIIFEMGKFYLK